MKLALAFVVAATMAATAASRPAPALSVAWLRDGRVDVRTSAGAAAPETTSLGSTWKLFVYAFAVEKNVATPVYRCGLPRKPGDEYCCDPGQAIERDHALARSCGLFFDPIRLNISTTAWQEFWRARAGADAQWLLDLRHLGPETEAPLSQLLRVLATVPDDVRAAAERALLPVVIDGYGHGAVAQLGGLLRAKTYTWSETKTDRLKPVPTGNNEVTIGGAAGWLVDGTPVWFKSTGSSRRVLLEHADQLAAWLPPPRSGPAGDPCVVVDFFAQYPIRAVDQLPAKRPASPGQLRGAYRVLFQNGNALTFTAASDLHLTRDERGLRIRGQFAMSEYVARVLDREADATVTEAARALAIVARSWTLQNAPFERGCYIVADSTRMQRVSANPPGMAARAVSYFTDGLILDGTNVRYHRDTQSPGVMAWTTAVQQANAGLSFDLILAKAFPQASLGTASGERECRHLTAADAWLTRSAAAWQRRLAREPGFEAPDGMTVCALDYGNPYADRSRNRIYVRGVATTEDRISIAHEYVHLAFRFHPKRDDEAFVEATARELLR